MFNYFIAFSTCLFQTITSPIKSVHLTNSSCISGCYLKTWATVIVCPFVHSVC